MGTWGTGILDDDLAADVYADYMDSFEAGTPLVRIRIQLEADYTEALDDSEDSIRFWLALAQAQWDCGALQPDVLTNAVALIESGEAIISWEDALQEDLTARKRVLEEFAALIRKPNPNPRTR